MAQRKRKLGVIDSLIPLGVEAGSNFVRRSVLLIHLSFALVFCIVLIMAIALYYNEKAIALHLTYFYSLIN